MMGGEGVTLKDRGAADTTKTALLKGAITKRTLKGAMPASTARLTAALTVLLGKVLDIMS